jgi:hypothetical protein
VQQVLEIEQAQPLTSRRRAHRKRGRTQRSTEILDGPSGSATHRAEVEPIRRVPPLERETPPYNAQRTAALGLPRAPPLPLPRGAPPSARAKQPTLTAPDPSAVEASFRPPPPTITRFVAVLSHSEADFQRKSSSSIVIQRPTSRNRDTVKSSIAVQELGASKQCRLLRRHVALLASIR